MQRRNFLLIAPALVAAGSPVLAQSDKGAKQMELKAKATQTLDDFYKADPRLKDAVLKAPGYAVFTTFGLSFVFGGAAGKGLAHDAKSSTDTFMSIAQASAGVQIGASDTRYLFVFDSPKSLAEFIDKGWDASAGASVGAGAGNKAANAGAGAGGFSGGMMYTLTKGGLQAGAALGGLKAWKDSDLN